VTKLLLDSLPEGRVIAADAAPSMVEEARAALGESVEVIESDLTELELGEQVDAVFSNAVFHWIGDHDALFARMRALLRPGGRLVAQCGGAGNVERFHEVAREVGDSEPFAEHLAGWVGPWNFAGPEETERRLLGAGFRNPKAWLDPHPVVPDHTLEYLRTVCLGHHVLRLPEDLREEYVAAVAERCGEPVELDYVRLNIDADV
jgi:trans-aconitate 2-methyltransferase